MDPSWFKEYLTFHRVERFALVVFVILLTVLVGLNLYQRYFWKITLAGEMPENKMLVAEFLHRADSIQQAEERTIYQAREIRKLFAFDPNTLDSLGWVALGFSPKQSAAIINYRSAGAIFRKPEDLKKLFVVDDERYAQLQPFIEIAQLPEIAPHSLSRFSEKVEKQEEEVQTVELNTVDSVTLIGIKGIGPFFAHVIMEYREKLGGYREKEQVMEVYGMDSAKYARIEKYLTVDVSKCTFININTATAKELQHHPYISFNQAKVIVNYRKQHGAYRTVEALRKTMVIDDDAFKKIAPYCKTQ